MATMGNKRAFNGLVGNVVFRTLNNKQIVQSRPAGMKQTTATQESASEFGSCSHWAKQLRSGLTPFLVGLTDSSMHKRFTTTIYNSIKSNTNLPKGERTPLNTTMESLLGFEFNTHSPFATYFRPNVAAELQVNNEVVITLPGFDPAMEMAFPDNCTTAKLLVFVLATDFKETTAPLVFHNQIPISQETPMSAQELLHSTSIPQGYFVLAAVKLLYYTPNLLTESNYLNTKDFSPAMVVMAKSV